MANLLFSILEGVLTSVSSCRSKLINTKFKRLKKEKWFQEIVNRYGMLFQANTEMRNFIERTNIEEVLKDPLQTELFQLQLEKVLAKENF
ncbi:hypothetical protein [Priestia filamentosa]|uniref:hypothetical protein n=1 Tax=Priestia filamentosa TaxID=1402861 RepID=UPI00234A58E0|nr:hypothetical protein [Priestia filamentosa]WCM16329.1 hypothetical protein PGN40_02990 [Priestia filamentosa]